MLGNQLCIKNKKEMAQQFNAYFSSIADKLRTVMPNISPDLSKLGSFINSRKRIETAFVIPSITWQCPS